MMFAAAAIPLFAAAVPRLQMRAEIVADGELKAKVLENARGIPAPTLQMRQYTVTSNGESKDVKWYLPRDVWRQRAFVGEWKDASGNVMRLARVLSLVPTFEREDWYKDEIEKRLDGLEKGRSEIANQLREHQRREARRHQPAQPRPHRLQVHAKPPSPSLP